MKEEEKIIEEACIRTKRKVQIFISIISAIPENSIWGIQEYHSDIELHYPDWSLLNKCKTFDIKREFGYICPDVYFTINAESRKLFIDVLNNNPTSIECYFWHNIFFKNDIIYAEVIEENERMLVNKCLNISIQGHEDWVDYL